MKNEEEIIKTKNATSGDMERINYYRSKVAKDDDTFEFGCNGCGDCCRHRDESIILSGADVFRLARYLEVKPDNLFEKHLEYKQIYTGSGIQSSINKVLDFDGCDVHIRPHRFRHNTATILEDSGASDHSIGTQLGIKNPNTIRVYTDRGRGIVSRNSNIIEDGINKKYKMNL